MSIWQCVFLLVRVKKVFVLWHLFIEPKENTENMDPKETFSQCELGP